MNLIDAKEFILNKLAKELNPDFTYHKIDHTLDVYESVVRIAEMENIKGKDLIMLKTAALFHDSGMLRQYIDHEEASIEIMKEILPVFDYSNEEIEEIGNMIMATKLPQNARSFLGKILCDADLDYLGRDDFIMISHQLRHEWNILNINKMNLKQWYDMQVKFLENHKYYTDASIALRQEKKIENLNEIKELLNCNK